MTDPAKNAPRSPDSAWRRAGAATLTISLFFLAWGLLLAGPTLLLFGSPEDVPGGAAAPDPTFQLLAEFSGLLAALMAAALVIRLRERPRLSALGLGGFDLRLRSLIDLALGSALGVALILLATGMLWLPGYVTAGTLSSTTWAAIFMAVAAVLSNAVTQEVMIQGIVLRSLLGRFPTWTAILVTAALFTALHAGALIEGAWIGALNILLAGALLGCCYLVRRRLWLPIGVHFGWNLAQGPLLGVAVSGKALGDGWLPVALDGPTLITGGGFGLEGGLAATVVTALGLSSVLAALRWSGRRAATDSVAGPADDPPRLD